MVQRQLITNRNSDIHSKTFKLDPTVAAFIQSENPTPLGDPIPHEEPRFPTEIRVQIWKDVAIGEPSILILKTYNHPTRSPDYAIYSSNSKTQALAPFPGVLFANGETWEALKEYYHRYQYGTYFTMASTILHYTPWGPERICPQHFQAGIIARKRETVRLYRLQPRQVPVGHDWASGWANLNEDLRRDSSTSGIPPPPGIPWIRKPTANTLDDKTRQLVRETIQWAPNLTLGAYSWDEVAWVQVQGTSTSAGERPDFVKRWACQEVPQLMEYIWHFVLGQLFSETLEKIHFVVPTKTSIPRDVKKFLDHKSVSELLLKTQEEIMAKYRAERIPMNHQARILSEEQEKVDLDNLWARNWIWAHSPSILSVLDLELVRWARIDEQKRKAGDPVLTWDLMYSLVLPCYEDDFVPWLPPCLAD